ncbi:hypothetical protein [Roseovarius aquimarinus]|uniref:Uncharacterized protein n=1 Tax=Roseovarius aquimarinus TaxID=1229156 RepID=A0ABW7IA78_9RHOB
MWAWIAENSAALSVLVSCLTALIWIGYFQLLFISFRRQRRTRILINRGAGKGTDARCLISNMGAEPLYVMSILATIHDGQEQVTSEVADLHRSEKEQLGAEDRETHQGPLMSGDFMDIGRFSTLIERCARGAGGIGDSRNVQSLHLLVIAAYGADDLSVGAERHFTVCEKDGETLVDPDSISTTQLRSRSERRRLERTLDTYR